MRSTNPLTRRLRVERLEVREVPASLSGRVFLDFNNSGRPNGPDTGISGVTLSIAGGDLTTQMTAQTDAQGNFSFTELEAGSYTLTETQPTGANLQDGKRRAGSAGGNTSVPNVISAIELGSATTAKGYFFAEVPQVGTGGSVYDDVNGNGKKDDGEPGVPDVVITLTGTSVVSGKITPITTTTDDNGNYQFALLTPGRYTIAETQPAGFSDSRETNGTPKATLVSNDKFIGVNLAATAATSTGFDFGEVRGGTLGGSVFGDANDNGTLDTGERGIPGVRVQLTGRTAAGVSVARGARTDIDGEYLFSNLRPGTYAVRESQPAGYPDGEDKAGTSAGTVGNDRIIGIEFASGATATGYTFAETATADLKLTQTPRGSTINPGGTVTMAYTLTNRGTAPAIAPTVKVNYGGLTFVSASTSSAFDTATRTWTVGSDLAAGATLSFQLTLKAAGAGTFTPSARATTTSTELFAKNNVSVSLIASGVPTPPPPATDMAMKGASNVSPTFRELLNRFNQYDVLTRLWLYRKVFG